MSPHGPYIRRRQLGRQLRMLREQSGKTQQDAAEWLGVAASTVNKIENGKQASKLGHVRLLLQLYGVGSPEADTYLRYAREASQRGWWASYSDTVPDWFRDYVGLETDASVICTYDPEVIHGLLQTPDYSRALRSASLADPTEDALARFVDVRQARQDRLDGDDPPKLHVVLGEGALHRAVGGAASMAKQLDHLLTLAKRPNITLQVHPFSAGAHPAMVSPFTVLRFDEDESVVVYLETDLGGVYVERSKDVARYTWIHERLRATALSAQETLDLVATLMVRHRNAM